MSFKSPRQKIRFREKHHAATTELWDQPPVGASWADGTLGRKMTKFRERTKEGALNKSNPDVVIRRYEQADIVTTHYE